MITDRQIVLTAAGVAVGVLLFEVIRRNGAQAVSLVNPADPNNVVNQGTNAVVSTISGGNFLSLGDWLFNIFNPSAPGELNIGIDGLGTNDF
jgi:hypothetical protein